MRIPIPDRPGAAAEVFTLAAELGVNIADFEVVHSAEGDKGILYLLVEATNGDLFRGGLHRPRLPAGRAEARLSGPTTGGPAPLARGPVEATVAVPGSKSMTNRALVLAALADGPSTVDGGRS